MTITEEYDKERTTLELPEDAVAVVLSFLPPSDLIRSVSLISRPFLNLMRSEQLWKELYHQMMINSFNEVKLLNLNLYKMQQVCLFSEYRKRHDRNEDKKDSLSSGEGYGTPSSLRPSSMLVPRDVASKIKKGLVCHASTTDHPEERIENVLPMSGIPDKSSWRVPVRSFVWADSHWSSSPASSGKPGFRDDTLLFTTRCPDALISDVAIMPFTECRLLYGINQTYTWPGFILRVYRLPVGATGLCDPQPPSDDSGFPCLISTDSQLREDGGTCNEMPTKNPRQALVDGILDGYEPVYESPIQHSDGPRCAAWQNLVLPPGVVGNVITITLLGKHNRQFPTSGFYACVDRVVVLGIPLYKYPNQHNDLSPASKAILHKTMRYETALTYYKKQCKHHVPRADTLQMNLTS
eukprot:scaffold232293_cov59-Attheya_sp.AAC.2